MDFVHSIEITIVFSKIDRTIPNKLFNEIRKLFRN